MQYLMTHQGRLLSLEEAFEILMDYNVIFIGEVHELRVAHEAELAILTGLSERDPNLVLALEMFERDVPYILDAYLNGEISEDTFLERSRSWPNYQENYRPLIELAKKRESPLLPQTFPGEQPRRWRWRIRSRQRC